MGIVVLSKSDVQKVISLEQTIADVENVYGMKAKGETVVWPLVSHDFEEQKAVMDIRSGYVAGKKVHGAKMLNNFPGNLAKGLPNFTGMMMVFDSETGLPMGVMDASYITCMRTGAAGGLGVKYLAAENAENLLMLGAGNQSAFLIGASAYLKPGIKTVFIHDPLSAENAEKAAAALPERLRDEFGLKLNLTFKAEKSLEEATRNSQIVLTATRSCQPLIKKEWVAPGTHFSCIGADMEGKEEIDPAIFKGAKIYADDIDQCVRVGEMELAIKQGFITKTDIAGEIGELVLGTKPGRESKNDITIFDATGLALLDLAVAGTIIEEAKKKSIGTTVDI